MELLFTSQYEHASPTMPLYVIIHWMLIQWYEMSSFVIQINSCLTVKLSPVLLLTRISVNHIKTCMRLSSFLLLCIIWIHTTWHIDSYFLYLYPSWPLVLVMNHVASLFPSIVRHVSLSAVSSRVGTSTSSPCPWKTWFHFAQGLHSPVYMYLYLSLLRG